MITHTAGEPVGKTGARIVDESVQCYNYFGKTQNQRALLTQQFHSRSLSYDPINRRVQGASMPSGVGCSSKRQGAPKVSTQGELSE